MLDGKMPPLYEAAHLVKQFECFLAEPYLDAVGVPTIGYGTTHYPNGTSVTMKDAALIETSAFAILMGNLAPLASKIWTATTAQPTVNQWSAMLSLAYNIGLGAFLRSTLLREFNAGAERAAGDQFLVWDKIVHDGKLVECPGLLNRRIAEHVLFLTPDESAAN